MVGFQYAIIPLPLDVHSPRSLEELATHVNNISRPPTRPTISTRLQYVSATRRNLGDTLEFIVPIVVLRSLVISDAYLLWRSRLSGIGSTLDQCWMATTIMRAPLQVMSQVIRPDVLLTCCPIQRWLGLHFNLPELDFDADMLMTTLPRLPPSTYRHHLTQASIIKVSFQHVS